MKKALRYCFLLSLLLTAPCFAQLGPPNTNSGNNGASGGSGTSSYVYVAFAFSGAVANSQVSNPFPCPDQIEFPANFASTTLPANNSQAACATNPNSTDTYTVSNLSNSTTIGTIVLSTGCKAGLASTFSTSGFCTTGNCIACTPGQILSIQAPSTTQGEASVTFILRGTSP